MRSQFSNSKHSSSNQAVVAVASKTQKSAVYTLNLGDTMPTITELNTSSMLGRFLWSSGSASSQPRALRFLENSGKLFVIALCQDEMIRVWAHDGQMKLESEVGFDSFSSFFRRIQKFLFVSDFLRKIFH